MKCVILHGLLKRFKITKFKRYLMKKPEPAPKLRPSSLREISYKDLASDDAVNLLNKINEEYMYWDKVKYQPIPKGLTHREVWTIVKLRRKSTPFKIQFGNYQFYWNQNSRIQEYLHFLDMNVGGSLESSANISPEDKDRYLLSSIMEEAIASSQIEGAATTRKHAKEMLRKNMKPRTKSEQMIHNNYVTIQKILEIKSEPLTLQGLLSVHKLITANTLGSEEYEGYLREDDEVRVVDTIDNTVLHHPPSAIELKSLLDSLFNFFNNDNDSFFIHPIIKASIIHFMIGFIHPFVDGNGRAARALFYWYLLKRGYWLIEYLSISRLILRAKAAYGMAFLYTENDENDLTYFIAHSVKTMKQSFEELRSYIKKKNEQKRQLSTLLGIDGLTYRQALVVDWFRNEPDLFITITEAAARLGTSYMSARLDLLELTKKGYLDVKPINKVSKGFVKGVVFNTLINKVRSKKKWVDNTSFAQPNLFDGG